MKKLNTKIQIGISLTVFLALAIGAFMNTGTDGEDLSSITTYPKGKIKAITEAVYMPIKIILEKAEAIGNALFDIVLTIPEKSREIIPEEDLLVSIELINFGGPGKTNVSLSYIITNSDGDIVLIEHEKRIVETQDSFLKTIDMPDLKYGDYKILVEMLYSNTSAIATGEFRILKSR